MRITGIDLDHFGHFRAQHVDLDHPAGGLRIVLGPNEAGKSTLLRAVRVGLFGAGSRTVAGERAADLRLRVGYTNAHGDGTVTRSGLGRPVDASGTALDDDNLRRIVGVDESLFTGLFTVDHDELRRHGHELLQSDGSLGALIFGAALGGPTVRTAGDKLDRELDAFFAPRARTRRLNELISGVTDADTALRDMLFTADKWSDLRKQIEEFEVQLEGVDTELSELQTEKSRLVRTQTIRPLLRTRSNHLEGREEIDRSGAVPDDATADTLTDLLGKREDLGGRIRALDGEIKGFTQQLSEVPSGRGALERATEIELLNEQTGEYRKLTAEVKRLERIVRSGKPLEEAAQLRSVVEDLRPLIDDLAGLPARSAHLAGVLQGIEDEVRSLHLGRREVAAVLELPVPPMSTINAQHDVRKGLDDKREHLVDERKEHNDRIERERAGLESLQSDERVPDPDAIGAARSHRDAAVQRVERRLADSDHAGGTPEARELGDDLAARIREVDMLVDVVLSDTDRAAKVIASTQRLHDASEAAEQASTDLGVAESSVTEWQGTWQELWDGVGIDPATPSEMRDWQDDWSDLCKRIGQYRADSKALKQLETEADQAHGRLREALAATGDEPAPEEGIRALFGRGERLLADFDERSSAQRSLEEARAELGPLDDRIDSLRTLLGTDSTATGEHAIKSLAALKAEQKKQADTASQREGEITDREKLRETAREKLGEVRQSLADAAEELATTVDDLQAAVDRSERRQDVETKLREVESQIRDAGSGLSIEGLIADSDVAGDPDELAARLEQIGREVEDRTRERDDVRDRRNDEQNRLDEATGGADAAAANEDVQDALTTLGSGLEGYVVLALARALLDEVLDEAGMGEHGELIGLAGRWFSLLTDGEFLALEVESSGEDAFAAAVRADGSRLYVPSLSDGTQDQLWVALRLAGIAHHVERVGPVPVIIDDALVNFDDRRLGCTLEALAELAERTQVIVITHHRHLVDIAVQRLGEGRVAVGELSSRPNRQRPAVQVVAPSEALAPEAPPEPRSPRGSGTAHRSPNPVGTPRGDRGAGDGASDHHGAQEAVLGALDPQEHRSKADVTDATGISDSEWSKAISELVDAGLVARTGKKRGTRYRRVDPGSSGIGDTDGELDHGIPDPL